MLRLIAFYQRWISPFFPPRCRYVPSCSNYAYEAIQRYGILRGGLMGVWRICRCNPFSLGGYDPVPQTEQCPNEHSEPVETTACSKGSTHSLD